MRDSTDPRVARVREVFDDWARRGRAEGMETSHTPFAGPAFEMLQVARDATYLDIGCGNGYTVRWAAEAAHAGRCVGLDVSPEMIARARALSREFPNAEFHLAEFPDHPLQHASFDAVFSMEVFYYLPDLHRALEEVRALLKPGGRFACAVDFYGENAESHGWPADVGVEMSLLTEREWRDAFARAGLTAVEQVRIRVPPEAASESWEAIEGSLVTVGTR